PRTLLPLASRRRNRSPFASAGAGPPFRSLFPASSWVAEDWAFGGRFPRCSSNESALDSVPVVQMLEQERPEAQGFRYLPASGI
uniref:Uncharacterized protein n=1 Tax=Triticum urartu TaxID=4572 RepID=A0A8R7U7M0_TRIUA